MKIRVGFGFDVHELREEEEFWLGGILVPHSKGAYGHSDADVLSTANLKIPSRLFRNCIFHNFSQFSQKNVDCLDF